MPERGLADKRDDRVRVCRTKLSPRVGERVPVCGKKPGEIGVFLKNSLPKIAMY